MSAFNMKIIHFGIIAFGGSGRATAQRLAALDGVNISAVLDPDIGQNPTPNCPHLAETTFHQDIDEFFSQPLDAVFVSSPDHTHFNYARVSLTKQLPTLVEKPAFVSLAQCRSIAAILQQTPILFGAHHQKRFFPAFFGAHEIVRSGDIGDIVHIEVDYIHDMRDRAFRFHDWRAQTENPQQVAFGLSSHSFDLVRWITAQEAESVYAIETGFGWPEYPAADSNITTMSMSKGTTAKVTAIISSRGPQRERLAIFGTKGQIHNNLLLRTGKRPTYITNIQEGMSRKTRILSKILGRTNIIDYPYSVNEHNTACNVLLKSFVSAMRGYENFPVGFSDAAESVRLCVASVESARRSAPIALAELPL